MSSDTFRYRIDRVDGRDVLMTIRPTTAGGLADLAWSRSFVLMILERRGLPIGFEHTMDAAWLAEHLDEYVTRVEIVRLVGIRYEQILRRQAEQWHIPAQHLQPSLTLRVTLASEAIAAYLPAGASDGTTAFDVWIDPAHPKLELAGEEPPPFDPQPDFANRVATALLTRLRGWQASAPGELQKTGADALLRVRIGEGVHPRSHVTIVADVHVPAFNTLFAAGRSSYVRDLLVSARIDDVEASSACWHRRFAGAPPGPCLEYFDDDAPQESFDALVDCIARALDAPGLDALLTRDGLRGHVEQGIRSLPVPKGRSPAEPIGAWPVPVLPAAWRWVWMHGRRYLPELIWSRVALHAAFGTREEARVALAQVRAISKQVPAVMKPFLASLDEVRA